MEKSPGPLKTTLLIPALNEIEGMKALVPRIRKDWVDQILVIDGGSTDGTAEYAKVQGYSVIYQSTRGITNAYREALKYITGDIVVAFSADGNSVPELIPSVIEKMKQGYDMVVVSRYLNGTKSHDDDFVTQFGNWLFTQTINLLFGGRYTDSLVMFRAWRTEIVQALSDNIPRRAGFEPLLSIRCAKQKLRVTEISGEEPKRIGGIRKMNPLLNGIDILRLIGQELNS